jgi:hypothetical protein
MEGAAGDMCMKISIWMGMNFERDQDAIEKSKEGERYKEEKGIGGLRVILCISDPEYLKR